jgi:uncharacterized protein
MERPSAVGFFDINCFVGCAAQGTYRPARTVRELEAFNRGVGAAGALVYHIMQYDYAPQAGNAYLAAELAGSTATYGCTTLLPPQTGELPRPGEFFKAMREGRMRALRAFPLKHHFALNRITFGMFLDDVSERKVPLLLSVLREGDDWGVAYELLAEYPKLTCVLCDTGVWGADRFYRPLVERYDRVFLDTSMVGIGDGLLESLCKSYGADRLLYGSGFPERVPEASMLSLLHAELSDSDVAAIASENAHRLLEEAELD